MNKTKAIRFCAWAVAAPVSAMAADGVSVSGGHGSVDARAGRLAVQWHWRNWYENDFLSISSYWDLSAVHFDTNHREPGHLDTAKPHLTGIALAPVFRADLDRWSRAKFVPFVELGIGFTLLDGATLRAGEWDSKHLGTHWQFEDRAVIGTRVGSRWELAYQRIHYSNANFSDDNEGINVNFLLLGYRF